MTQRLLRHIPSGILYAYQPAFAVRPDFEEVIDVEAREVPATETRPSRRKKEAAPVATVDEDALSADASRNLP